MACPTRYDQSRDVLARHGFVSTYRELHLACAAPLFPPPALPAPPAITMVERTENGYLAVRAMAGDQEAGICLYMRLSKYSDHPEADAWGYVDWLHVAETQRRRGLGATSWFGPCGGWLTTSARILRCGSVPPNPHLRMRTTQLPRIKGSDD